MRRNRRNRKWFVALYLIVFFIVAFCVVRCVSARVDSRIKTAEERAGIHIDGLDRVRGASGASREKVYEGFRLSFNPETKVPDWVAWELLRNECDGDITRSNRFHSDYSVPGCPESSDYTRSGYDRGHMCPAADQKWSSQAMSDCFFMTNMAPQKHELNNGAWKTLEEKERLWALRDSALVIVAGPVFFSQHPKRIGEARVAVPDAFFKVILSPYTVPPRAIGFVYDNARCPGNMKDYATSVDKVEALTGLDFFYELPDSIEDEIEGYFNFNDWNGR